MDDTVKFAPSGRKFLLFNLPIAGVLYVALAPNLSSVAASLAVLIITVIATEWFARARKNAITVSKDWVSGRSRWGAARTLQRGEFKKRASWFPWGFVLQADDGRHIAISFAHFTDAQLREMDRLFETDGTVPNQQ